ncbi:MAG: LptF/LptG family permease [Syntrophobacteraceae bacterium]
MRKTLFFYLLWEQTAAVLICLIGVVFILITGQLLQLITILFASSCGLGDLAQVVLFALLKLLLYAAPMATLMGTMLAFLRLNADNELIAFRSAGTSFLEFLPPVLVLLVFATALAFFHSIFISPVANFALEQKVRSLGRQSIPALIKEGNFISTIPKLVFFFKSVDRSDLSIKGVFVQDHRQPNEMVTITAERAQIIVPPESNAIIFLIEDGRITRADKNLKDAQTVSFKNYDFTIMLDELTGAGEVRNKRKWEMNLSELFEEIKRVKDDGTIAYLMMEVHQRFSLPSACLLLGLLGPPLGSLFRQRNRMTGITIGVGIFVAYYVILSAGRDLAQNNVIPTSIAAWTPNLLGFALTVYLWRKLQTETPFPVETFRRLGERLRRVLSRSGRGERPAR